MFQTEPSNSQQPKSESSDGTPVRRRKFIRIAEVIVGIAFVAVLVYVAIFAVRISSGVTRDSLKKGNLVRLQILNGCGINGLAAEIGGKLNGYSNAGMEVRVVDTDNFELKRVPKSFLVSRIPDLTIAQSLATKLGLDPLEVTYEPLERNVHQVLVTLVLGDNFGALRLESPTKEK